jgi:3-hydroxybenzoate 6-monooxygenase
MVAEHPGNIETALKAYRDRRVLRTARVQIQSRALGDHVYHPGGPHAALRNAIMRNKTQDDWYEDLAWLYGSTGLEQQNFG